MLKTSVNELLAVDKCIKFSSNGKNLLLLSRFIQLYKLDLSESSTAFRQRFWHSKEISFSQKKMLELKTLDRNYKLFANIGVCALPRDAPSYKKLLYIFNGAALCVIFVITAISGIWFVYEFFESNLTVALGGVYAAAAVFGSCSTMLITFYFRHDLLDTFIKLEEINSKSKFFPYAK